MSELIETAVCWLAFGKLELHPSQFVKFVATREIGDGGCTIRLLHAIDVSDFSSLKCFLSINDHLFEVDFMSRHEIIPPMSADKLPEGWQTWGIIKGNQLFVTNRSGFVTRMMTADSFVALPMYRFDLLADDIQALVEDGMAPLEATRTVLSSPTTGYSHIESRLSEGSLVETFAWRPLVV